MPTTPVISGRDSDILEDPLLGFNFLMELEGKIQGMFTECSGIGSENEVVEHKVVDSKGHEVVRKIPGRLTWQDVTLKRGLTANLEIWEWRQLVVEGKMSDARGAVTITMLDREYNPKTRWHFANAWPSKVTGPSIASDDSSFSIEEVTLVHEGMYREE